MEDLTYTTEPIASILNELQQKYISNFKYIHLYDPGEHKVNFTCDHNAYIVLFASRSQENMKGFHSKYILSLLMPPFTLDEVKACLTECNYVETFTDVHTYCFHKWGGAPYTGFIESSHEQFRDKKQSYKDYAA